MVGFYGKLPAKGDFLSRNLPRDFVDTWDDWLHSGMQASRQDLGDAWLDTYLTSPLWRFVLPAGCCGTAAWAGIWMPSIDRVGRYFPMAVVSTLSDSVDPLLLAASSSNWFESVEALLLTALEDEDLSVDKFDEDLQAIALQEPAPPTPLSAGDADAGTCIALGGDADISAAFFGMLTPSLSMSIGPCSYWWGRGSELVAPCLLVARGLPESSRFTAFLDGQWSAHGWTEQDSGGLGIKPAVIDVASL